MSNENDITQKHITQKKIDRQNIHTVEWHLHCPIASALALIGDRWSLLILRDLLLFEARTHSEFQAAPEAISTNILADRLRSLSNLGLITKADNTKSRNSAYILTPAGRDLEPTIDAELGEEVDLEEAVGGVLPDRKGGDAGRRHRDLRSRLLGCLRVGERGIGEHRHQAPRRLAASGRARSTSGMREADLVGLLAGWAT